MKYLSLQSLGGVFIAFSVLAAFPMTAQSAEKAGKSESAIECGSGPSHATRVEWGLPTTDCTAQSQPGVKTPGGVMGPIRSSESARFSDPTAANQRAAYGAQPTPY